MGVEVTGVCRGSCADWCGKRERETTLPDGKKRKKNLTFRVGNILG